MSKAADILEEKLFDLLEKEDPEGKSTVEAMSCVLATLLSGIPREAALDTMAKIVVMMEVAKLVGCKMDTMDLINRIQNQSKPKKDNI